MEIDMGSPSHFLTYFEKFEKATANLGAAIAAKSLALAVIVITVATLLRYFFNIIIPGVDEMTGYILVIITYFGLAYGLRTDAHINIDLIQQKLPIKAQNILWIFISITSLIMIQIYQFYAVKSLLESISMNETALTLLETPLWIPKSFICIGWVLMTFSMLHFLVKKIIRLRCP
jgi:TRAP-type C4-dicarboxylate transport system permease small subunit